MHLSAGYELDALWTQSKSDGHRRASGALGEGGPLPVPEHIWSYLGDSENMQL